MLRLFRRKVQDGFLYARLHVMFRWQVLKCRRINRALLFVSFVHLIPRWSSQCHGLLLQYRILRIGCQNLCGLRNRQIQVYIRIVAMRKLQCRVLPGTAGTIRMHNVQCWILPANGSNIYVRILSSWESWHHHQFHV